jgi:hypothetical protein
MNKDFKPVIEIKENPQEIINYIQFGTNLPVLKEFHIYILSDLNNFNTKSIILKEDGKIISHVLMYDDGGDTLYFGFFKAQNHDKKLIKFLVNLLIDYGRKHNFKYIRGPINIPTFIYGWGFMQKGSLDNIFISKPVNHFIYQEIFKQKGFYVKSHQGTWEGTLPLFSEEELQNFDFTDYETYQPKDWNELRNFKRLILSLSGQNLSQESQITPNPIKLFDNFVNFVECYGDLSMLNLLKYNPSEEYIGCYICLPNPLRKDDKGLLDSFIIYSVTIEKKHRSKGLSLLLHKEALDKASKNHMNYCSAPIEINRKRVITVSERKGLAHTRTHLILENKL